MSLVSSASIASRSGDCSPGSESPNTASSRSFRRGGEIIPDPLLAHLAPVGWQHINLTGDYLWDADTQLAPDGFRQLRAPAAITAHAA